MKKNILLLTENFPPIEGGSGRWFWELYSRLEPDRIVIATHDFDEGRQFDLEKQLNIVRLPLRSIEWGFRSISGLLFYWRCFWQVKALIKRYDISEIHCGRVIHEGVTAWLLKLVSGMPYKCYVHGEDVETAATSREQALLVRQVCKQSDLLICNSENSKSLVSTLDFESTEKCTVLNPGVDTSQFLPAPTDKNYKSKMGWQDKTVLLTVGRLQRRKGQDYLVKAMPHLLKQFPNLFYAIVGRGECEDELRNSVTELGLTDHVGIYTDLDDEALVKSYQQCDIFILPNRTIGNDIEGFGMVLVEAQACGKPVIAGDSGGTAETMLVGESGEIIDCSSPERLASALNDVLKNKEFLNFGDKGLIHVRSTLDWNAHVEKAKALFKL